MAFNAEDYDLDDNKHDHDDDMNFAALVSKRSRMNLARVESERPDPTKQFRRTPSFVHSYREKKYFNEQESATTGVSKTRMGLNQRGFVRDKTPLNIVEDTKPESSRDRAFCDPHWAYYWCCLPYMDKWLPCPSKRTLKKTLNRIDFNAYNPYDVYQEYYHPYWTFGGILITLGCLTLLVIFSIFAVNDLIDDNRIQQTSFGAIGTIDTLMLPSTLGIQFFIGGKTPLVGPSLTTSTSFTMSQYFTVTAQTCTTNTSSANANANANVVETCNPVAVQSCIVNDIPAICPVSRLPLIGGSTDDGFSYGRLTVTRCSSGCAADITSVLDTPGGEFGLLYYFNYSEFAGKTTQNVYDNEFVPDPSFAASKRWPILTNRAISPVAMFQSMTYEFPSKVLRDSTYVRSLRLHNVDYDQRFSTSILFDLKLALMSEALSATYYGSTILDTASNIGGIFMLCLVLIAVWSGYMTKNIFLQSRKFTVNPEVLHMLLTKKKEQLAHFKMQLTEANVRTVTSREISFLSKFYRDCAAKRVALAKGDKRAPNELRYWITESELTGGLVRVDLPPFSATIEAFIEQSHAPEQEQNKYTGDQEMHDYRLFLKQLKTFKVTNAFSDYLSTTELYEYLNAKRDAELSTYRNSLFSALHFEQDDDAGQFGKKKKKSQSLPDQYRRKRMDELLDLDRVDAVERMENPGLAKMLNILAMEELKRQLVVLDKFFTDLSSTGRSLE
jgi:hypothetical protein